MQLPSIHDTLLCLGADVADLDLALRDARQTARGEQGATRGCLDTFLELAVGVGKKNCRRVSLVSSAAAGTHTSIRRHVERQRVWVAGGERSMIVRLKNLGFSRKQQRVKTLRCSVPCHVLGKATCWCEKSGFDRLVLDQGASNASRDCGGVPRR